ncbi:signal transduction histidine kinase [Stanieria sp. NIES-3757]|nr:signal transduction histidine kinase [Stanieria sp. NIES-3757]
MEVIPRKRGVGLFSDRRQVELAVSKLKNSGFPMEQVAIVVRNAQGEQEIHGIDVQDYRGNHTQEGAVTGILTGGAIGSITGLLIGLGVLAIPGIGPILLAGTEATALVTALAGGTIGGVTGGLVGALIGLGIPETRVKIYRDGILRGDYLIIIDGTESQLIEAQHILERYDIDEWNIYDGVHQSKLDPEPQLNSNSTIAESSKHLPEINARPIKPIENHQIIESTLLKNNLDYEPKTISDSQIKNQEIIESKPLKNSLDEQSKTISEPQLQIDNPTFTIIDENREQTSPKLTKNRIYPPSQVINNKPKVIIVDLRD